MRFRSVVPAVISLILALFFAGCETIPETGRQRLMLFAPSLDQESALAAQAFQEAKAERGLSKDARRAALVREVGQRISAVVGDELPNAQWEFVLLKGDEVNAFCLPGGRIAVYEGLFRAVQTEDELAFVMGHEVAHAVKRHGAERMSNMILASLIAGVATELTASARLQDNYRMLVTMGTGMVAQGVLLKYSREQEYEADQLGLFYTARAGYDPRASIAFWSRMSELSTGPASPEWLSTHPSDAARIARLQALMPQAMEIYRANARHVPVPFRPEDAFCENLSLPTD
jgi:predicted Zn-dependent protease